VKCQYDALRFVGQQRTTLGSNGLAISDTTIGSLGSCCSLLPLPPPPLLPLFEDVVALIVLSLSLLVLLLLSAVVVRVVSCLK